MDNTVTYYKFYSEIRHFIEKLVKNPIKCDINTFLKEQGFNKEKLIHALIKRGIIKRKESIKDPTNSEEKQAMYYVKYSVIKEGFEDKIKKMFNEYFKQNINEIMQRKIYLTEDQITLIVRNLIKEDGEGGVSGGNTCTGVGGDNGMEYTAPAFGKSKNKNRKEKGLNNDFFKDSVIRKPGFSVQTMK